MQKAQPNLTQSNLHDEKKTRNSIFNAAKRDVTQRNLS